MVSAGAFKNLNMELVKINPKKVTKKLKIIPRLIESSEISLAVSIFFSPKRLEIRAVVPVPIPAPTDMRIKKSGNERVSPETALDPI